MSLTLNGIDPAVANMPRAECVFASPFITAGSVALVPVSTQWTVSNYAQAGTFSTRIALRRADNTPAFWDPPDSSTGSPIRLDAKIIAGYLAPGQAPTDTRATGATVQFQGLADHVALDPIANVLEISGRDYSALLIDYAVTDSYLNMKSSEIVQKLAAAVGLTASVTPTTRLAGAYFQIEHKHLARPGQSRFKNAWDLMSKLASYEGYDLWVDGKTVYFQPPSSTDTPLQAAINTSTQVGYLSGNFCTMQLERDLIVAKGVHVKITSWDARQRTAHSAEWPKIPSANAEVYSPPVAPNMSAQRLQALAETIYNDVIAHRRTVTITVPGDFTMQPRKRIQVQGTGLSFDQVFRIESITRQLDKDGGFQQTVVCRNRDPAGDAA